MDDKQLLDGVTPPANQRCFNYDDMTWIIPDFEGVLPSRNCWITFDKADPALLPYFKYLAYNRLKQGHSESRVANLIRNLIGVTNKIIKNYGRIDGITGEELNRFLMSQGLSTQSRIYCIRNLIILSKSMKEEGGSPLTCIEEYYKTMYMQEIMIDSKSLADILGHPSSNTTHIYYSKRDNDIETH